MDPVLNPRGGREKIIRRNSFLVKAMVMHSRFLVTRLEWTSLYVIEQRHEEHKVPAVEGGSSVLDMSSLDSGEVESTLSDSGETEEKKEVWRRGFVPTRTSQSMHEHRNQGQSFPNDYLNQEQSFPNGYLSQGQSFPNDYLSQGQSISSNHSSQEQSLSSESSQEQSLSSALDSEGDGGMEEVD